MLLHDYTKMVHIRQVIKKDRDQLNRNWKGMVHRYRIVVRSVEWYWCRRQFTVLMHNQEVPSDSWCLGNPVNAGPSPINHRDLQIAPLARILKYSEEGDEQML
jgi:hypothetical protein